MNATSENSEPICPQCGHEDVAHGFAGCGLCRCFATSAGRGSTKGDEVSDEAPFESANKPGDTFEVFMAADGMPAIRLVSADEADEVGQEPEAGA